jgi:tetratricopeptide (TPR) repeat protein
MRMAVEAGLPGAENTEWARTKLGDLYLDNGNADSASILYRTSLVYRPSYPYANMGMARVERAHKNYDAAIAYTKAAIQVLTESSFVAQLADLYELKGDAAKAAGTRTDVVALLLQGLQAEPKDALVKHNANRELATACMNAGQLDKALAYATADLGMRPGNIDANELAAWIYYLKGDYASARSHADKMLITKTRNANTLYKAAAIYTAAGDASAAAIAMHDAVAVNPVVDPLLASHCKPALALTQK